MARTMRHAPIQSIALLISLVLAGCAGTAAPETAAPRDAPMSKLLVTATDFALAAPAIVQGGLVEVTIENRGTELHHVTFFRLEEGRTLDDLRSALDATHGATPSWARAYGGPEVAPPGGSTRAIVDLDPGQYVIACLIPSMDGMMHAMKGMMALLTVTPATGEGAAPAHDATATLLDFSFSLDRTPPAGPSVLRVVNEGEHTHMLALFELFDGATTMDFLTAIEDPNATAPPPGRPVGGTTSFSPGETVLVPLDLTAGRYTFVCFDVTGSPEPGPHFLHGMVYEFDVK